MNDLERSLADRIAARGPITFAEYMHSALYDPRGGYYRSGSERTGWGGDFITSPELDPAFATLWARAFRDIWVARGSPDRFDVVEVGPGEGGFVRSLLATAPGDLAKAMQVTLVEIDPERRARLESRLGGRAVRWAESIENVEPFDAGVVFANEILDNQPVHVLRNRAGGFQEMHVDVGDGGLEETWLDCTDEDLVQRALASDSPAGAEIEISLEAEELALACARLPRRGAAFFVDYGRRASSGSRSPESLASYSSFGAGTRTLAAPGQADLTAHVDWDAIADACRQEKGVVVAGPVAQRAVLAALGAHDLDDELRTAHQAAVAAGRGADALAALSRRQALGALLDPGGLGGLHVLAALKGVDAPPWLEKKDRP